MSEEHPLAGLIATEQINPRTRDIDLLPTEAMLHRINEEDAQVAHAVQAAIPAIAPVVDCIVAALQQGGRLFYVGAGTSGRLGVLDASECPPTYGTPPDLVQALIAGGERALRFAVEGAEDSEAAGRQDAENATLTAHDVMVGISASGRAAYVRAALQVANQAGAVTAALCCNPRADFLKDVQHPIVVDTGPEVVAGSTRMKAGTAQKLVLNMLTTGAMIQLGKTYENLMVDVQPTNQKLKERACRIVAALAGTSTHQAEQALNQTHYQVKPAVLMLKTQVSFEEAQARLHAASGKLRVALQSCKV